MPITFIQRPVAPVPDDDKAPDLPRTITALDLVPEHARYLYEEHGNVHRLREDCRVAFDAGVARADEEFKVKKARLARMETALADTVARQAIANALAETFDDVDTKFHKAITALVMQSGLMVRETVEGEYETLGAMGESIEAVIEAAMEGQGPKAFRKPNRKVGAFETAVRSLKALH